jgi:hypothetical protein
MAEVYIYVDRAAVPNGRSLHICIFGPLNAASMSAGMKRSHSHKLFIIIQIY